MVEATALSKLQPIPGDMRLRITLPNFAFRITNLHSVNLCTNKETSMEMWTSEISIEMFLTGTEVD